MSNPTSVRLSDGAQRVVRELSTASKTTDEVPEVSQAEIIRLLVGDAMDRTLRGNEEISDLAKSMEEFEGDVQDLVDLLDNPTIARYLQEQRKDEGWYLDMVTLSGFQSRVRRELKKRFENGYRPQEVKRRIESFRDEASDWWGPGSIEEDEETYEDALDYIDTCIEDYGEQYDQVDMDVHEQWVNSLGPNQDDETSAINIDDINSDLIEAAEDLVRDPGRNELRNVEALADAYGASAETVRATLKVLSIRDDADVSTTPRRRESPDGSDDDDDPQDGEETEKSPDEMTGEDWARKAVQSMMDDSGVGRSGAVNIVRMQTDKSKSEAEELFDRVKREMETHAADASETLENDGVQIDDDDPVAEMIADGGDD